MLTGIHIFIGSATWFLEDVIIVTWIYQHFNMDNIFMSKSFFFHTGSLHFIQNSADSPEILMVHLDVISFHGYKKQ